MLISGDGLSTFNVKIKPEYTPATTLALNWIQLANYDWACTDRGYLQDKYDVDISIYGLESVINTFIGYLEDNRNASTTPNILTLSGFNSQEYIFGSDLDYTDNIYATAFMGRRSQGSWKGYGLTLTLKCISPSFLLDPPASLPQLKYLDIGYDGDSDYTINKVESYNRVFYNQEHNDDSGSFTGTFLFNQDEMSQARRFVATKRGDKFLLPNISGVQYPFGRRGGYGKYVRITSFEDLGMYSLVMGEPRWKATITFSEAFV